MSWGNILRAYNVDSEPPVPRGKYKTKWELTTGELLSVPEMVTDLRNIHRLKDGHIRRRCAKGLLSPEELWAPIPKRTQYGRG